MTKFEKCFGFSLLGASVILLGFMFVPMGCNGFVDPISEADKAFVKAVRHDVDETIKRVELLEKKIDNKVDREIVKVLEEELKKLGLKVCNCDPTKQCNCGGDNKPVVTKEQWYRSSTDPNIYYYGYIGKDGVLYYTYMYYFNQNLTVRSVTATAEGKSTTSKTPSFLPTPITGIKSPNG